MGGWWVLPSGDESVADITESGQFTVEIELKILFAYFFLVCGSKHVRNCEIILRADVTRDKWSQVCSFRVQINGDGN